MIKILLLPFILVFLMCRDFYLSVREVSQHFWCCAFHGKEKNTDIICPNPRCPTRDIINRRIHG